MVFEKRPPSVKVYDVAATFGIGNVKGDVGLEIEVEGNTFRKTNLPLPWTYHRDNSLRGQDNAEYVFGSPQKFGDVNKAVDDLWEMFKADGSKLDDSNRTSVHVHLNVSKFYLDRLTTFMGLYFALEQPLTAWCGEHREGNLFCLRATDAPAIVTQARRFIRSDMRAAVRDGLHYAGMSILPVSRLGSIEIRTMRGVSDPEAIKAWVDILRRLYDLSGDYRSPVEFIEGISNEGPLQFFDRVLGERSIEIRRAIDYTDDRLRDSLYDGVRMAQELCYCRDWGRFEKAKVTPDPFGRPPRATRRTAAAGGLPRGEPEADFDVTFNDLIQRQQQATVTEATQRAARTVRAVRARRAPRGE